MKRFARHSLTISALLATVASFANGCAENNTSLFIQQAQARIPAGVGAACTVSSSADDMHLLAGYLDVAFNTIYSMDVLVGSQMVARANPPELRTETARIQLQGTEVRLEDSTGAIVDGYPYTVPGAGFINPAVGSLPQYGVIGTIAIDSATGAKLRAKLKNSPPGGPPDRRITTYNVIIRAFGKTLGGTDVESGEWQFPINVCYGCLISYPPDANDVGGVQPNCDGEVGTGTTVGTPCVIGNDDPVDCRLCRTALNNDPICQPSTH